MTNAEPINRTSDNEGGHEDCWFCNDALRLDKPPGGWLYDDGIWRAGHVPPSYAIAGTVIIESHRHFLDQAEMDDTEAATLNHVVGTVIRAIKQATGCDRVYQWATMDGYPHYHLWLIPWWESSQNRGPRYLVSSVVETDGCTPEAAQETVSKLRAALA